MWANFLQFVPDGGIPFREVAALAKVVNLNGLQRWGYLQLAPDPADSRPSPPRRDWVVQLTRHGTAAAQVLRPLAAEIGERWRDRLGAARFGTLRNALASLADLGGVGGPGRLPYLPVSGVYRADPGTLAAAAAQAAARWPGGAPGPGPGLDLPGLLSAVLLGWRLEYEREAGLSLPVSANAELFVPHDGQAVIAAGLVPHPDGWRAHPPYRARTEAMISDPAAALPHYPMVSHRGGYPDGS